MELQELAEIMDEVNSTYSQYGIQMGWINGRDNCSLWVTLKREGLVTLGYESKIFKVSSRDQIIDEVTTGVKRLLTIAMSTGSRETRLVGEYENISKKNLEN